MILIQQAKLGEAENILQLALEQQRKLFGCTPDDVVATLTRLGSVLMQDGRVPGSEVYLSEALEISVKNHGRDSIEAARAMNYLAVSIAATQTRIGEGIALFREAFAIRRRSNELGAAAAPDGSVASRGADKGAPENKAPETRGAGTEASIDTVLAKPGSLAEVEAALRDTQMFALTNYGKGTLEEAFFFALTAWVMLAEEKFDDAEAATRNSLKIRENLIPNDWSVHHAHHMLGAAKAGQGKVLGATKAGQERMAEAETLLIDGFQGMKDRYVSIPTFHKARLGEAALRIKKYFLDRGMSKEAAKWQAVFDGLPPEAQDILVLNLSK
ncbi:MAG: tetratricopeptide repeat protein [Opitutus sp.]|nr:tetratricopeptide repeat protein [Opitutus sp.]